MIRRRPIPLCTFFLVAVSIFFFLQLYLTRNLVKFSNNVRAHPGAVSPQTTNKSTGISVLMNHQEPFTSYCKTKSSLNEMVFKMANYSSPSGSASYNKTRQILGAASSFHINLVDPIFQSVANNIAVAMVGYGLKQKTNVNGDNDKCVILIEGSYHGQRGCVGNCTGLSRIIVQTEQLFSVGKKYLANLQACHKSPTCIIWEFSDFNYEWAKKNNFSDSVILIPTMIQSRLAHQESALVKSLSNRSLDVVFFGSMTRRRRLLREQAIQNATLNNWTILFGNSTNQPYMGAAYNNAKICLVAHSYSEKSGGEYHRLSEFGPMGCIPVMENFSDTFAIDDYIHCAGVVFAKYNDLLETVAKVLMEVKQSQRNNTDYVRWWQRGIQWENMLVTMFGEKNETGNDTGRASAVTSTTV